MTKLGPLLQQLGLFSWRLFAQRYDLAKLSPTGAIVTEHKFKIGRLVVFRLGWPSQVDAARGVFQIIRRLPPAEDGEFQYEIRSEREGHNRVAKESELTPA